MMDFSEALNLVKNGNRIFRAAWGVDYVVYQRGYPEGIGINANTASALGLPEGTVVEFTPYLTKLEGSRFTPWVPTMRDLLADDWMATKV